MNPDDLKALGDAYSDFADALVDWRGSHPIKDDKLSKQFDRLVADVVKQSDDLGEQALTAALAKVQTSVGDLKTGTKEAQQALNLIKDVTKVFSIGDAVVSLGGCLLAPTVTTATVASELSGVVQAIQKATAPPPSSGGSSGG